MGADKPPTAGSEESTVFGSLVSKRFNAFT